MTALLAQATTGALDTPDIAWSAIAPHSILVGGALVLLTVASLARRLPVPGFYTAATVLIALGSMASAVPLWVRVQDEERGPFTAIAGAIGADGFSVFFVFLIGSSVILAALLADGYLRREGLVGVEFYILMLLSAAGGLIMASANDLIVVFLGLETLSIAVYVLSALHLRRLASQEAAIKYFVLGAFSSAFFLYGIALVYGATGSTNLVAISTFLADNVLLENGLLLAGFALLLVGFGFKVAAVPFHAWTPDVYQGAPTPAVAYMASGVKAAGFAGLLRVFLLAFPGYSADWDPIVYAIAVVTMLVGAVLAVVQTDVKRMLAYSSINHAGFILVGVQAATDRGTSAALFYLLAYTFMVAGSFGIVTLVGGRGDAHHSLDTYRGLGTSRPLLAVPFTVFLLAQAGVPLTSGFLAKFEVIGAAVDNRSYWLALIAMVSAVIAAFIYLRIIVAMYMTGDDGAEALPAPAAPRIRVPATAGVAIGVALAVTLVVGFVPSPVTDLTRDAIPALVASG